MPAVMKHLQTGEVRIVSSQEAAQMAELDEADITWAIEQHGVCETNDYEITSADGKTCKGASENNIAALRNARATALALSPVSPCPPGLRVAR